MHDTEAELRNQQPALVQYFSGAFDPSLACYLWILRIKGVM